MLISLAVAFNDILQDQWVIFFCNLKHSLSSSGSTFDSQQDVLLCLLWSLLLHQSRQNCWPWPSSLSLEDHHDLMELPQAPCISFWDLTLGLWIAPGPAWGKRKWALQLSTTMPTAWTWGGCQEEACSQNLQQTDPRRFERWPNPPGLLRRPEFFDDRSPEVVETWLWRQCF